MKNICYMFCGADNVGKTTLIRRQMNNGLFAHRGKTLKKFSVPSDIYNPFAHYYEFLSTYTQDEKVLFCDRGFIDTYFYSQYRDGMKLEKFQFQQIYKFWKDSFICFMPVIVKRPWEYIEKFHEEELKNKTGVLNEGTTLEQRKADYIEYYKFMNDLIEEYPDILYLDLPY